MIVTRERLLQAEILQAKLVLEMAVRESESERALFDLLAGGLSDYADLCAKRIPGEERAPWIATNEELVERLEQYISAAGFALGRNQDE